MSDLRSSGRPRQPLTAEQQALVTQHIPLAEKLCAYFLRQSLAYYVADDLRSAALEALHDGVHRHDPARGPFGVYIWRRIDGALSDTLRREAKHWRAVRHDIYDAADVIEDKSQILTDSDADTVGHIDGMSDSILAAAVLGLIGRAQRAQGDEGERLRTLYARLMDAGASALSALDDQDRGVLEAHYFDGRTWQQIGAEHGWPERTAERRGADARRRFVAMLRCRRESTGAGAPGQA